MYNFLLKIVNLIQYIEPIHCTLSSLSNHKPNEMNQQKTRKCLNDIINFIIFISAVSINRSKSISRLSAVIENNRNRNFFTQKYRFFFFDFC